MLKLLKKFTYKEWLLTALSVCLIVFTVWLELTMVDYMADITMLVQSAGTVMKDVWIAGGKMLACAVGSLISSGVVAVIVSRIGTNFSAYLRRDLFGKVQSFSMAEIGHFSTASLITRTTNDVQQVEMFVVLGLQVIIKAPVTAIWAICKIATNNWQWTLSAGIAVVVLIAVILLCVLIALPKFKKIQAMTDNLNRVTRENLTGLPVVRAYNAEDYQEEKFERANTNLTKTNLFTAHTMTFMMPSIQLIMNGLTLAIYWIGAYLLNNAALSEKMALFTDMVTFMQYAMQVVMAFMLLVMIFMILPRASVAAQRVNEVLNTPLSIKDGELTVCSNKVFGEVEFRNVSFAYSDADESEKVLDDISFVAHRGETVAFIGSTGCGKSSVINLVPRFYDATSGEVLVDGVNVKEYTQETLRNKIGYVSQKAILFSGDIRQNIAYGENGRGKFSEEDIETAIQTAQADDFISKKDGGLDGVVAQAGDNFSGGQKQRISIARAIARRPEIFIFDDSFSALDYKTDKKLRDALNKQCADATKLIVAQRIGTIKNADKIIVLDEGKIVGQGTHNELMKSCDVYRQIAHSQLSEEELA